MTRDLEPLDPELKTLLDREREAEAPGAALQVIRSRLAHSLPGVPDGSGSHLDSSSTLSPAAKVLIVTAFAVGGVLGAGLHALLRPQPQERVVYVEQPTPPRIEVWEVASSALPVPASAPSMPASPPAASTPHRPPAAVASAASSLLAERAILDRARVALSQGDAPHALTLLDEHSQTFPRPQLTEEREALAVQALVIAGHSSEARARGERFRATWPSSLFLPAVDASLESIP